VKTQTDASKDRPLLGSRLVVVNVGLQSFAEAVEAQGERAVRIDWRPPPKRDDDIESLLRKVL